MKNHDVEACTDRTCHPGEGEGHGRPKGGVIHFWLVQGNTCARRSILRALHGADEMVCTGDFSQPETALRNLADRTPPDIILLDLGSLAASDLELVRRVRALAPSTGIIVLTAAIDLPTVCGAIGAGAAGFLLRTTSPWRIIESIRDVYLGGASFASPVARVVLEMVRRWSTPERDYRLTPREQGVLELMTHGLAMKEIAERLDLSYHTVDTHCRNIYGKLEVHSRGGAVAKALRDRVIQARALPRLEKINPPGAARIGLLSHLDSGTA